MALPKAIGLIGYAGSGKTTAARFLELNAGYRTFSFAAPLKKALKAMGLSEDEVNGSKKETPLAHLCGKSPRQAMQYLGTEWGRKCIGPDLWVKLWLHETQGRMAVADDVRFRNECDAIKSRDGILIRISRPSLTKTDRHESETALSEFEADVTIVNDGDFVKLRDALQDTLREYTYYDRSSLPKALQAGGAATTAG